jgi:hypothetical protein
LFLWHYNLFGLTLLAMLALLASLIAIYLGWVTVATIANVTSVLDFYNWSGWGISDALWAVIILAAGTVIASLVALRRGDVAYMLAIIWAFLGIAVKHASTPLVAGAAWVAAIVVAIMMMVGAVLHRRRR